MSGDAFGRAYARDLEWIVANPEAVWQILHSDDGVAEGLAAARATVLRRAAAARQEQTDKLVLQKIVNMAVLPAPRNLVGVLARDGGDRAAIRASLKRLASQGLLPEQYIEHFTPMS